VFDGQATVQDGDKQIKLKADTNCLVADNAPAKAESFKKKAYETGDLYSWSSLRSSYLAEANVDEANMLLDGGWGGGWGGDPFWGPGWGWGGMGWGGWGGWGWDPGSRHTRSCPGGGLLIARLAGDFIHPALSVRAPFYGGHSITALMPRTCMRGGRESTTQRPRAILTACTAERERRVARSTLDRPWLGQAALVAEPNGGGFGGGGFHGGGGGFHGGGGGGGGHGR